MDTATNLDLLEELWDTMPAALERDTDWALQAVLASGVAGYTTEPGMPPAVMIRHNPDGSRELVRINLGAPDTVFRAL